MKDCSDLYWRYLSDASLNFGPIVPRGTILPSKEPSNPPTLRLCYIIFRPVERSLKSPSAIGFGPDIPDKNLAQEDLHRLP